MEKIKYKVYGCTDIGKVRKINEDRFLILETPSQLGDTKPEPEKDFEVSDRGAVFILCDGMGGYSHGEFAAEAAIDAIRRQLFRILKHTSGTKEDLEREFTICFTGVNNYLWGYIRGYNDGKLAIEKALIDNELTDFETIHSLKVGNRSMMGTTVTICWLRGDQLYTIWVGDSRAYLLRKGEPIRQINKDHTNAQKELEKWLEYYSDDEGMNDAKIQAKKREYEKRNSALRRGIGDDYEAAIPEVVQTTIQSGDRIILCSDGLNHMLYNDEIEATANSHDNIKDCAHALVDRANEEGGIDNTTIIVIDIL